MAFDILDAYWVAGTNPTTQVFSSAAGVEAFVANNAAAYQTWLSNGNFGTQLAVLGTSVGTAGVVRLQLDASQLQTGQRALIAGVTGTVEANGFVQFNKIDATHIDLVGTTFATAWRGGGTLAMAAILATDAELWTTFNSYAVRAFQQGALLVSTSVDLTLTGPLKSLTIVTETGVTKKVILPNMRSPRAPPMGYTFSVKNGDSSTQTFTLYAADGSTVVRVLDPTDRYNLVLTDNSTTNGTFEVDPPQIGGINYTPWIAFSPTITSSSGTLGTPLSTSGTAYKVVGKTCYYRVAFSTDDNGTGAVNLVATSGAVPIPSGGLNGHSASGVKTLAGTITALAGKIINNSGFQLTIVKYDGTYPGATGAAYLLDGSYQIA